MRRLFWLAAGLGAGISGTILFSRWLQRQAERFAPPNLARQAGQALTSAGGDLSESLDDLRRRVPAGDGRARGRASVARFRG